MINNYYNYSINLSIDKRNTKDRIISKSKKSEKGQRAAVHTTISYMFVKE